jgi:hypothetical protein
MSKDFNYLSSHNALIFSRFVHLSSLKEVAHVGSAKALLVQEEVRVETNVTVTKIRRIILSTHSVVQSVNGFKIIDTTALLIQSPQRHQLYRTVLQIPLPFSRTLSCRP